MGIKLGYQLKNDGLDTHQTATVELIMQMTGTGIVSPINRHGNPNVLVATNLTPVPPTQTQIDALLGSTNEFLASAIFDAVSLGSGSLNFVLNCDGQIADVIGFEYNWRTINGSTIATASANLKQTGSPAAGLAASLNPLLYVSSAGNIAVKNFPGTNISGSSIGIFIWKFYVILK